MYARDTEAARWVAHRLAQKIVGVNAVALSDARVPFRGAPLSSVGPERRLQDLDQEETPSSPPPPRWPVYACVPDTFYTEGGAPLSRGIFIAPRQFHDTDPPTTTNPPCE